jgi:hypothetical protein
MARRTATLLALLLTVFLTGCHGHAGKALAEGAIVAAAVTAHAVAQAAREQSSGSSYADPPDPPPDPPREPQPLPLFNEAEARAELRNVDVSPCVPAADTAVHARVTFASEGPVAQVVVDAPLDLPEPLSRCVGTALASAHVYAFREEEATTTISLTLRARD